MRILKIRRGYTTNSSSANEWVSSSTVRPEETANQNLYIFGGIGIFIITMFILEALIRKLIALRRRRENNEN